jgi:S1-C subfamily serine protease
MPRRRLTSPALRAHLAAFSVVMALVALGLCAGCSTAGSGAGAGGGVNSATPLSPNGSAEATSAFESAAASVSRVVVNVSISQNFNTPQGSQPITTGNGSGIIITSDGYILTNDHVVSGSNGLLVGLGMTQIPARVIGEDPSTDLAVIKIARTGLFAAQPGDPRALKRGQWVIAVGSPFGLERTVTTGIVSALNRSTVDPTGATPAAYTNLIQTDAAINPGNSGGALATLDGRIVGVNSLTESPNGASAGVGLAIPFDFAMSIARQLIRSGHAVHPYIGVSVIDLDQHVAKTLGVRGVTQGALVQGIAQGSPAQIAGVKIGDVITSVGGQPVTDSATLFAALRAQAIGQTVAVDIVRAGKPQTVQVTIGSGKNG